MELRIRHRPRVAAALVAILSITLLACGAKPRPGVPPRHLVLLTVEGLRADHVTLYGYSRDTTYTRKEDVAEPHDLDAVIEGGVCFRSAFAPTGELRAGVLSLLTGRSPLAHGVLAEDRPLPASVPTLAERFREAGFATAAFVHATSPLSGSGAERGFASFEEVPTDTDVLKGVADWFKEQRSPEKGHFLWVHFGGIAPPFLGPPLEDRFSERDYCGPLTGETDFLADWGSGAIADDPANRARLVDLYDGRVRGVAELIDVLVWYYWHAVGDDELWDRTVFVVAGTSGMELAERGGPNGPIGSAHSLQDTGLRIPLVLRHTQSLTGQRILDEVVDLADVAPTLTDWFGLAELPGATGRSLLALTDSYVHREFPSRPALALDLEGGEVRGASLRSEQWRLVDGEGGGELYRIDLDPRALRDVAGEHPDVAAELSERLRRELEQGSGAP